MASASGREGQPVHGGKVRRWLWKVFEVSPAGLNWPRAVLFLDVALVLLAVFHPDEVSRERDVRSIAELTEKTASPRAVSWPAAWDFRGGWRDAGRRSSLIH